MNMMHVQALSPALPKGGHGLPPGSAQSIAAHAAGALEVELLLTPKPGLVDRRNSGAHSDMDIHTFQASARALAPWWQHFVKIGADAADIAAPDALALARPTGVLCEQAMLRATAGVNTHKGAVFALGLLCFSAGRLLANGTGLTRERLCGEVAGICAGIVTRELAGRRAAQTAGERAFHRHGFAGARGEAASGFATVRAVLPVYDRLRRAGVAEELALLQVLLHLLAVNNDTNLVSRGGIEGLDYVRTHASLLLEEGGVLAPGGVEKMAAFDDALIARHLSPGGSADLLGLTWFLGQFPAAAAAFAGTRQRR